MNELLFSFPFLRESSFVGGNDSTENCPSHMPPFVSRAWKKNEKGPNEEKIYIPNWSLKKTHTRTHNQTQNWSDGVQKEIKYKSKPGRSEQTVCGLQFYYFFKVLKMTRRNENRENFGRRKGGGEDRYDWDDKRERAQRTANRPSPSGNEREKRKKPLTKILATGSTKPPAGLRSIVFRRCQSENKQQPAWVRAACISGATEA